MAGDPALESAVGTYGLHGFMLLSEDLYFRSLRSMEDKNTVVEGWVGGYSPPIVPPAAVPRRCWRAVTPSLPAG